MKKILVFLCLFSGVILPAAMGPSKDGASKEASTKAQAEKPTCPICLNESTEIVFFAAAQNGAGCGHMICKPCGLELVKHQQKCPLCRVSFVKLVDSGGTIVWQLSQNAAPQTHNLVLTADEWALLGALH